MSMAPGPGQPRPASFYFLAAFFVLFLLFLYGPMIGIYILSFQGPQGGMSFPMVGWSTHWFQVLLAGSGGEGVGDVPNAFGRSMRLAAAVSVFTVAISVAAGLGFRRKFRGSTLLFYTVIISMVMPSIFVGFGIALVFRLMGLSPQWWSSGLGAQLTWTLPFGVLIMFIVMGRFNPSYEEAATDLGASSRQRVFEVILPILLPGIIGIAMAGFTGSYDEFARTSLNIGSSNTLPMEIMALTTIATSPVLFAVGSITTVVSFLLIGLTLALTTRMARRRNVRTGSEA
jgi:putative spermidine/putrescine transport system permease protein